MGFGPPAPPPEAGGALPPPRLGDGSREKDERRDADAAGDEHDASAWRRRTPGLSERSEERERLARLGASHAERALADHFDQNRGRVARGEIAHRPRQERRVAPFGAAHHRELSRLRGAAVGVVEREDVIEAADALAPEERESDEPTLGEDARAHGASPIARSSRSMIASSPLSE